jgi:hypothetical protein
MIRRARTSFRNKTMATFSSRIAVGLALLAMTGCGSGSGSSSVPQTTSQAASGAPVTTPGGSLAAGKAALTLTFAVPSVQGPQSAKRAAFISPSTQSFTVAADGAAPSTVTSNCSAGTCTATLQLTPGSHTLAVRLWDAANGGGSELASNTAATCPIVADTPNTCTITMYGFPATIALASTSNNVSGSLAGGFTFANGASTPFTLLVLDADGNAITGPGAITPTASAGTAFTLATPAPNASPGAYTIGDTDTSAQTITFSATPAPNADGSAISAPVAFTGASQFAGSLYYITSGKLYIVSATTGTQTAAYPISVSGAPYVTASQGFAMINGANSNQLAFYNLATQSLVTTTTNVCSASDNLPLAADGGAFYYSCGGTTYKYDNTGSLQTSWADGSGGEIAAGGGYVFTVQGTALSVWTPTGSLARTITLPGSTGSWGLAAGAAGVFATVGSNTYQYSPATGALLNTISTGSVGCNTQPVGTVLTVHFSGANFNIFHDATGPQVATSFSVIPAPQDCRVGFAN